MNEWHCCLVCEGSSDAALTNVLELLLIRLTLEPASVSARLDLKGSVRAWLRREASVSEKTLETYRDPKDLLRRLLSRDDPDGKLLPNGVFSVQRARILAELDTADGSALSRLTAWTALNKALADAIARARPWLS